MSAGYKRHTQNNITGNGSFDKIFLKAFKLHNIFYPQIGSFSLQFPDFQIYIPEYFLILQNVLTPYLLPPISFALCSQFLSPKHNFLVLSNWYRNGLMFSSPKAEMWGLELVEKQ